MRSFSAIAILLLLPTIASAQPRQAQTTPLPRDTQPSPSLNADALFDDITRAYDQLEAAVQAAYEKIIAAKRARLEAVRARLKEISPKTSPREFANLTDEAKRLEKEISALEKKRDEALDNVAKAKAKALAEARKFLEQLQKSEPASRQKMLEGFRRGAVDSVNVMSKRLLTELPKD